MTNSKVTSFLDILGVDHVIKVMVEVKVKVSQRSCLAGI